MPSQEDIIKEIVAAVRKQQVDNPELGFLLKKVGKELKKMLETTGLDNRSNLDGFYSIWQSNKGKTGSKNEINSWTAWGLGLTSIKPEEDAEFLPVRRAFARAGFPDIDTDFDYENRDLVYQYIIEKYGRENVGNIGTHGLLKFKSCVTRVVKALDLANAFHKGKDEFVHENAEKVTEILSPFPKKGLNKVMDENDEAHIISTFDDAYAHCPDFRFYIDKYSPTGIIDHIGFIERTFANFGYHAAGMVVSDVPLDQIAPLRTAKQGVLATQFPNEDLELLGLIKFDVLAISTLSVIKKTAEKVKENYDITIDLENLPMDDEKTFELYRTGNLGGVFQCENYGMQKTMKEIGVDRFEDIVAGLALYRPGPMDSIPKYCATKKGETEIDYGHAKIRPHVEQYLAGTYGILCYQEQVMQICNSLAGFSISDGYVMIKAIGKKKENLLKKFEEQFIDGCVDKGVPREVAKNYWDKFITPFASYGFNRAHSACYGYNSYTTAYLKANYPDEFVCALLDITAHSSIADRFDKVASFEKEFSKKLDIKFEPRHINKSKVEYTIEKKKDAKRKVKKSSIRPSLMCKGVTHKVAVHIESKQPFADFKSFVSKTDSRIVDSRVCDALLENGYFGPKMQKDKDEQVKQFGRLRRDFKKMAEKGTEHVDLFAAGSALIK